MDFRSATGVATASAEDLFDIRVEVVVVVHQDACLLDVIVPLVPQVRLLKLDLEDPRNLGLAARDWLIDHPAPADLESLPGR